MYQKNHSFLIDIFNELHKIDNNYYLILLGDSVDGDTTFKEHIIQKVTNYNLSNSVLFAGVQEEVNKFLNAADLFLLPSHYEGLPIVCLEAQATGLPCLLSDVISSETKITSLVSFYSLKNSAKEWAQKIDAIIKNSPKRCNHSEEFVSANYEIVSSTLNLQNLYKKLIKENNLH